MCMETLGGGRRHQVGRYLWLNQDCQDHKKYNVRSEYHNRQHVAGAGGTRADGENMRAVQRLSVTCHWKPADCHSNFRLHSNTQMPINSPIPFVPSSFFVLAPPKVCALTCTSSFLLTALAALALLALLHTLLLLVGSNHQRRSLFNSLANFAGSSL